MIPRVFGKTGLSLPPLGLGCSHIASLSTRASGAGIAALIDGAYEAGVRFFDTADIYGQGDSERRLRAVAARPGTVICTKAGLRLKASQGAIRLAKPLLRPVLLRLKGAGRAAADMRRASEDSDLTPERLRAGLEGSLGRLGRDRVDLFLLHSPPVDALKDGTLYDLMDRFRDEGKAAFTGVSCRTLEDAGQVIASGRVDAVQVPLTAATLERAGPVLDAACAAGVAVIAREVFRDAAPDDRARALAALARDSRLGMILTGTTNPAHLAANVAAVTAAQAQAEAG